MSEKLIFEKRLEGKGSTKNYDRADTVNGFPNFPEKHYFPKGTVPEGSKVVCRYYLIED